MNNYHIPPTRDSFQDHCPELILHPEYLLDQGKLRSLDSSPKAKILVQRSRLTPRGSETREYIEVPYLHSPIDPERPIGAPKLGDVLDTHGKPYHKKLDIDDIAHNPYTWAVGRVLSWKVKEVKFNITSAYGVVDIRLNRSLDSESEQPRLLIWTIWDFIIYSQVIRDNVHIFAQVSPYTRELSHPFELEYYVSSKRPGIEKEERSYKNTRELPFVQEHSSTVP